MDLIEILLILAITGFVIFIFAREIYKRFILKESSECEVCAMKSKRTLDEIRKAIKDDKKRKHISN